MKNTIMVVLVVYVFVMGCILGTCLMDQAKSDELPKEIRECTTDADCEYQAMLLCEAGHLEWCVKEA